MSQGKGKQNMKRAIGILLLVGSGVLGHMSYVKYCIENYGKDAFNDSIVGSVIKVKKEVPMQTYLLGVGAVLALGGGVVLVLKK